MGRHKDGERQRTGMDMEWRWRWIEVLPDAT
jgi:hypothetical protein